MIMMTCGRQKGVMAVYVLKTQGEHARDAVAPKGKDSGQGDAQQACHAHTSVNNLHVRCVRGVTCVTCVKCV